LDAHSPYHYVECRTADGLGVPSPEPVEKDAPRPGRKPTISAHLTQRVVTMTTRQRPSNATDWSTRTMAAAVGISEASVRRIWRAHGLKPHRLETFKISNDPAFAEKLEDIVGLYLNPPEHALVLCVDVQRCLMPDGPHLVTGT
jgi:hypothetical protein